MHRRLATLAAVAVTALIDAAAHAHTFAIDGPKMLLDGKPFQMTCGEMHPDRIPAEYWQDRLHRARAMGLNTVAIYVFWNVHEPEPGKYDFTGSADVAKFVKLAQAAGLFVFLRPGPYCCAEWEYGGFPYWLLKDRDLRARSDDPKFLDAVRRYDAELGKQLAPLQVTHGGPIIMVQAENEYGSYGKDKVYLGHVKQALTDGGFDVPFCTVDGPNQMAKNGSIAGVLPGINGGDFKSTTRSVDAIRPGGPYMVGEYYPGWLDHWGQPFVHTSAKSAARGLDDLLSHGISVNIYMVHGGTNFGFMNGANSPPYQPSITSYDYDAPIGEAGNITPKYRMMRDVLLKYAPPGTIPEVPADLPTVAFAPVSLDESAPVTAALPKPASSDDPTCMEDLNQPYGYVLYRTTVTEPMSGPFAVEHGVRDYAVLMVNGKVVGAIDRRDKKPAPVQLDLPAGATLDVLVENTGRINYGHGILDNRQGLTGRVTVGDKVLHGWQNFSLPMTDPTGLPFQPGDLKSIPAFHRGTFALAKAADTFLDLRGWGKGQVWVNGHNLGRFWGIGPQQTLYVPAPWLRSGDNDVVVLEVADTGRRTIGGLDHPILDQLLNPATRPDVPHGG